MNAGDSKTYPPSYLREWKQINPASKSSLPVVLDPVAAAIIAQLKEELNAKDRTLVARDQVIALSALKIQKLEEELRLERIRKYGRQSEKL